MRNNGWWETAIRLVFGTIWAVDAWLKWQPGFRATYLPSLTTLAAGEPGWLRPWFHLVLRIERPVPLLWPYLGAVTETLLALCVLLGFARVLVYVGGAGYSLVIWCTAGGFGAPYGPGATDIGPSVIYAVVFCALLALGAHGVDGGWNLDAVLRRRIGWWHLVGWPAPRPRTDPRRTGHDEHGDLTLQTPGS